MQRGITSVIILIGIAIAIVIAAILYGYFVIFNPSGQSNKQTVALPPENLIPPAVPKEIEKLGTPDCPDIDYTGCDNATQFATWDSSDIAGSEYSYPESAIHDK